MIATLYWFDMNRKGIAYSIKIDKNIFHDLLVLWCFGNIYITNFLSIELIKNELRQEISLN